MVAVPGPEKYTYRFGTINTKGEYVVRPEKMNIYREGRALFVQDSLNGRLALMLENGRVVTDHAFEEMEIGNTHITEEQNNMDFPEGAPVIKRDIRFAEGLVQYMEKGKYGYMDGDGTVVIPARFDFGFFFKNGEAPVKYRGKWGIINKKGEFVIGAKYGRIGRMGFEEGLCGVRIGGKWGFIDRNEKIVIKPQFWLVGHFSDGAASYAVNTNRSGHPVKYGYIDRSGKPFIQARLVLTMPFRNGLAVALRTASEGRHPYIIDKRCREILWDKYGAEMERMDDDYMILAREGQGGLYLDLKTMATLFVIDYRYYFISLPVNGIIYICFEKSKERAEYGYLDLEGNVIYRYTETGADNIRNGEF